MQHRTRALSRLAVVCAVCMFGGCAAVPGRSYVPPENRIESPHHAYFEGRSPDMSGSRLLGIPKANPQWWFRNSDEPLAWWWKPESPEPVRKRTWLLRNPLHNFMNYVIGVADRPTHRIGMFAPSIWHPNSPINLAITKCGPLMYLPMISYRGYLIEGYFGWRERGNFGIALRRAQHDSDGTGQRGRSPLSEAMKKREQVKEE